MLAGWTEDLPASWRDILRRTQLNWNSPAFDGDLSPGEIILPGRKGRHLANAPEGAHVLRAFENTDPNGIRTVLLGQDPYPNRAWATGRAFEQGNLDQWPGQPRGMADSLRRIVQAMVAAKTGDMAYQSGDSAWSKLAADANNALLQLEPPREWFDRLEREGVLFLNASLTIGVLDRARAPRQCRRHFQLWEPLVRDVLRFLAARRSGRVVYLLLGGRAAAVFKKCGVEAEAQRAGTWKTSVDAVRHCHPAAITSEGAAFLRPPNPFAAANRCLERMGGEPISW